VIERWRGPKSARLFLLLFGLSAAPFTTLQSQRLSPPIGIHAPFKSSASRASAIAGLSQAPRWVRWGLVGAVAGGVLFGVAGQSNVDRHRTLASDVLYGAATGFVLVGGSIALWDWLCHGDTRSRRSGLCGG
jgi:hypothetical protein